jgi:hypothetical protein
MELAKRKKGKAKPNAGLAYEEFTRQIHLFRAGQIYVGFSLLCWVLIVGFAINLVEPIPLAVGAVNGAFSLFVVGRYFFWRRWKDDVLRITLDADQITISSAKLGESRIPYEWISSCWPTPHGVQLRLARDGRRSGHFMFLNSTRPEKLANEISNAVSRLKDA